MVNQLLYIRDSKNKEIELPLYGEIKLTVVEGEIKFVETTVKEKI